MNAAAPVPEYLAHLVDDAAIFPPGNAPLDRAVAEHLDHRRAEYADLVGPFVVSDVKLPDLIEVVGDRGPLAVSVVVTGGAGAIEPAVRWAGRAPELELRALELALRDEEDLAHNAARVVAALDALGDELAGVTAFVEPPRVHGEPGAGWLAALDELAAREIPLKFRTGGVSAEAFPTSAELAACIDAALDRELPFKCTAGLHNAVRHRDEETGFEHHGFLNVLLATRATLDGEDAAAVLEDTAPAARAEALPPDTLARTRRWFTSFGSCSVLEPHHDLVELGLLGGN
ncbi:MAG TPA: hypothetical protein VFL69_07970 [Marmoricola sp.]|nr:hypothetical protein [Marmoricola sp.]